MKIVFNTGMNPSFINYLQRGKLIAIELRNTFMRIQLCELYRSSCIGIYRIYAGKFETQLLVYKLIIYYPNIHLGRRF